LKENNPSTGSGSKEKAPVAKMNKLWEIPQGETQPIFLAKSGA